ncbi:DUF6545 domain-containing protein [Mycobacterium riyadhense]|uniref:DUF6545 domain-containing protein n=1 Tax=Mycobacterium riyadhense TaxID=486698 RepID=UPI00195A98BB|nr:DUF6545 domain-containing protein [Mycobacterium riyadhense]
MTSAVPGVIAWPVIVSMAMLLVARYRLHNTNLYDTYFTNLMAFVLVAQLLREGSVEEVLSKSALMTVTTSQQLGFAAMIFGSTELLGFTRLWTGLSPEETRRGQRYYRLAAVLLCVSYLAAATRARVAGQILEVFGGWDAILAWSLYLTMILVLATRVVWMFASELRKATHRREVLLAVGGVLLGAVTFVGCMEALALAVTDQLGWTSTLKFRLWFHGFEFFCIAVFVFILGTVPLAVKFLAYLGLDPISRNWKKLQPLRRTMTTVVPESSFELEHDDHGSQKTMLQLHQTVIEIRDAILGLRPYFRDVASGERGTFLSLYAVPTREHAAAVHALQLAQAAGTKAAGAAPQPLEMAAGWRSRSRTLDEETGELLKIAKWWPAASAATAECTQAQAKAVSPA